MKRALAVLDLYILEGVRDIFAIVRRLLQKLVNLFELDNSDRIFFMLEQLPDALLGWLTAACFLQPVDFDAVIDEGFAFGQSVEGLLENQTTGLNDSAQLDYGTRHGIDTVIEHPVHRNLRFRR